MTIIPTYNVKPKSHYKVTKSQKAFVWSEDGEDFTIIDKNGEVIEGINCFTIEQIAEMFIQCAFEKIDKLTALKSKRALEIVDEISKTITELVNGEIGIIDCESHKGINFKRENNFLHQMLILTCRGNEEWNGFQK